MEQKFKKSDFHKIRKILFLFLLLLFVIAIVFFYFKISKGAVDDWSNTITPYNNSDKIDVEIKLKFNDSTYSTEEKFDHVFKYLLKANLHYKSKSGALVYYPGEISNKGRYVNAIEGFARFFPLASSWMYSNESGKIILNEQQINMAKQLKIGVLNGTNPKNEEYWGDVTDKDQRIVEAADIALALWLSRDYLWDQFEKIEKEQVIKWLNSCVTKKTYDNNWCLFPITIVKCLEALGHNNPKHLDYINELYSNYKNEHYLGNGWFDDPPKGIDYYNAWSIHYSLFWLDQIDPSFDPKFIKESHSEFLKFYKYFFGPDGFPIMGRSICYRLAAPSPIIAGSLINPEEISSGLAKRTLELTWQHFINNNALKNGKLTQGYYNDDSRLLDGYSGAGSCLWSLRSLIVAYYVDKESKLFDSQDELLPIEKTNYMITNDIIGWSVEGNKTTNTITLKIESNKNNVEHKLLNHTKINKIKENIYKRPLRPNNQKALYKNYEYTSNADILQNF